MTTEDGAPVLRSLCVYCGSNPGRRPEYVEAGRALARAAAARGIDLIYGGATVGVMGAVADAALDAGGRVVGVIPQALVDKELAHHALTELVVTASMHERKAMMAERADAFVALPGGVGTLEEIFEMWTWAQLGFHRKPCGLLNVAGYYDGLVAFLDRTVEEGFVRPGHREMLVVEPTPDALFERFVAYRPPVVTKWVGRGET